MKPQEYLETIDGFRFEIYVSPNGKATIMRKYSNGKDIRGTNYYANLTVSEAKFYMERIRKLEFMRSQKEGGENYEQKN